VTDGYQSSLIEAKDPFLLSPAAGGQPHLSEWLQVVEEGADVGEPAIVTTTSDLAELDDRKSLLTGALAQAVFVDTPVRELRCAAVLAGSRINAEAKTSRRRSEIFRETFSTARRHFGEAPLSWVLGRAHFVAEGSSVNTSPRVLARREAEALPPEGWYDEQIQLGEDRSEVAILVAAMELDGESINDRRSELVQIVGLFVKRRRLAVDVKLELTSPEPVESFDEDVHPFAG
jgi:hypothetical protein